MRNFIKKTTNLDSGISTLLASLTSRFFVTTANVPIQSIRIKISNNVKTYRNSYHFYGYKITLLRDIIYSGLFWSLLEGYRNKLVGGEYRQKIEKDSDFNMKNFTVNLIPAFIIGAFVSAVTTPLDTLKTRIQTKSIKCYNI